MDGREKVGNRLEHWLQSMSTLHGGDVAGKVSAATGTNKGVLPRRANKEADRWVQLLDGRTMINQNVLENRENKRFLSSSGGGKDTCRRVKDVCCEETAWSCPSSSVVGHTVDTRYRTRRSCCHRTGATSF